MTARLGLSWRPSGQAVLRGPLLSLARDCDRAFTTLADFWGAQEERHPATLPAATLQRVDYLCSFPHQASFAARLDPDEANLERFLSGPVLAGDGTVAATDLAPLTEVLTPAACYHVYGEHEGENLAAPAMVTTVNTCFRHETEYVPLRRLHSFTMREIVCMGTGEEVAAFIADAEAVTTRLTELAGVPIDWLPATDPFFRPRRSSAYLLQLVEPVKREATYGGNLAIASLNNHYDHFGAAFGVTRDGEPANSACLAFGIERWLFAIVDRHGDDPANWPSIVDMAEKAVAA